MGVSPHSPQLLLLYRSTSKPELKTDCEEMAETDLETQTQAQNGKSPEASPEKKDESSNKDTSTTGPPPEWPKPETGKINPELTDIESTDVESEEDNAGHPKGHLPTFLPTNFPTFDSPSSSPRSLSGLSSASGINYGSSLSSFNPSYSPQPAMVGNIKHSAIKPTAVVSPSRPRMPILPKPVPAAIASPVRVEKVSVVTNFMCSVCGAEFDSRENLVTHEQSTHWGL